MILTRKKNTYRGNSDLYRLSDYESSLQNVPFMNPQNTFSHPTSTFQPGHIPGHVTGQNHVVTNGGYSAVFSNVTHGIKDMVGFSGQMGINGVNRGQLESNGSDQMETSLSDLTYSSSSNKANSVPSEGSLPKPNEFKVSPQGVTVQV